MGKLKAALFLPSLVGGGAERSILNLSGGLIAQGYEVDMVLAKAEGPYLSEVPDGVRVVDLGAASTLSSLPALVRYLRRERPAALLAALDHANIVALWARRLSGVPVRTIISVRNTRSAESGAAKSFKSKLEVPLTKMFYPWADGIVCVSQGVADDLVQTLGLPRARVQVIYNPVVSDELLDRARQPVEHPWLAAGQPPVILSVGRLNTQKDYPTLLRAFAQVRQCLPCRLLILGQGEERDALESLVAELGLGEDVSLPGFADNPFAYMHRAALFVLSSRFEGLPGVLIQALACGCPVVSMDCPSGPREILRGGEYGPLVPVGDANGLARAMQEVLVSQQEGGRQSPPAQSWAPFEVGVATSQYARRLFAK